MATDASEQENIDKESDSKCLVLVDYRERQSGLAEELRRLDSMNVQEELMPIGDIAVGRHLIERKTVKDLWASLHDGRLFRQLHQLSTCPPLKPLLIIEGIEDVTVKRIAPGGSERMLWVASIMFGVPTLRTKDITNTARCIRWIAMHSNNKPSRARSQHRHRPALLSEQQIYVLSALPGIGIARAEALLQRFGSIRAVMAADIDAICETPGISTALAERIVGLLDG
jgi:DNA excision repair protein ERCC-4